MEATRRQILAGAGAIAFTGAVAELLGTAATGSAASGSAATGSAAARAGAFRTRPAGPTVPPDHAGYGPLVPDPQGLLDLPAGFRYDVLSRTGTPMRSGEGPVPSNCDGMGAFTGPDGRLRLVRNHENKATAEFPVPHVDGLVYDRGGRGGCTVLEPDGRGGLTGERVGIAGTAYNCAGGPTPWDTWLTCEETEDLAGTTGYEKDHGFVFEVDPVDPYRTGAHPLTALGRFQHEAVAVDPRTGVVYETEDAWVEPFGLFYRFLPYRPLGGAGSLRAGGLLEAMRVPGVPDLSVVQEPGTVFERVEWVPVPDPSARRTPVRLQDFGRRGVTHAQKLEGCYWGGSRVFFVSSFARRREGSAADHFGQVWAYEPDRRRLTLLVVFGPATDPALPGESPDNICLAPGGGLMVCEDGGGNQYVLGLAPGGHVYPVARGRQALAPAAGAAGGSTGQPEYGEFAGVTFAPDGSVMFVNCYTPGTTFAVTGPWGRPTAAGAPGGVGSAPSGG
ncbi:alkaline phosphatase PhoX [Streptomyces sp. NRRL S-87]|uniref:alkaline phosphatase PhoX n=1 Tax=Streptomyces sp. NRRL S-87 TaxID=1463920 RepID=UPI000B32423C|nr:alkaline phosphatase PhoX [Streptomyces sp. NRRL S-87]